MKRTICIILMFFLLFGCTASSGTEPSKMETWPKTSSESIAPLEDLLVGFDAFDLNKVDLSELPTELKTSAFEFKNGINLIAAIPEGDIALYAPLSNKDFRGVLVRCGNQLYKFDWEFAPSLLHAAWADYNNDGVNELSVGVRTMQGPQIMHEELHIVKLEPDGTAQDYLMPEKLYHEDLTRQLQCEMDAKENRVTIRMGTDAALSFTPIQPIPETLQAEDGIQPIYELVSYRFDDNAIIGTFGVPISCQGWIGHDVHKDRISVAANVEWHDGEFKLWNHKLIISVE